MNRGTLVALSVAVLAVLAGCPTSVDSTDDSSGNRGPLLTISPTAATVANGADQTFVATATDPDGDAITYSWYLDDQELTEELSRECTFNLSPPAETAYSVKAVVSDSMESAEATAILTVQQPDSEDPETEDPDAEDPDAEEVDTSGEPANNDATGAVQLIPGSSRGEYIGAEGDFDWYRVDLTAGNLLQIHLTQPESAVDPELRLYAPGDTVDHIWRKWDTGEPAEVTSEWQYIENSGTHYVRVSCYYDNADPTAAYSLTLTEETEPEPSATEPSNQSPANAVVLNSGEPHATSYVSHETDIDWFRIEGNEGELLKLTVSQADSGVDPEIRLFAPNDQSDYILRKWDTGEPADLETEWQHLSMSGSYYVAVSCYYDNSDITVPYTLTATLAAEPETQVTEPVNQTSVGAVDLSSQVTHSGSYISHETDIDWYRIEVNSGNLLQVNVTQPTSPVDPEVRLYEPGDFTNYVWRAWDTGEPASETSEWQPLRESGFYYLSVECYYSNSDITVPYALTVSEQTEPEPSATEPSNQVVTGAVPLTSGEAHTTSYISHETDIDWYTITATGSSLDISLFQNSSAVDPRIRVYRSGDLVEELLNAYDTGEPADIDRLLAVTPGTTYYLVVSCYYSNSDIDEPYTLTVTDQ